MRRAKCVGKKLLAFSSHWYVLERPHSFDSLLHTSTEIGMFPFSAHADLVNTDLLITMPKDSGTCL